MDFPSRNNAGKNLKRGNMWVMKKEGEMIDTKPAQFMQILSNSGKRFQAIEIKLNQSPWIIGLQMIIRWRMIYIL
jgi:hypothetical protein